MNHWTEKKEWEDIINPHHFPHFQKIFNINKTRIYDLNLGNWESFKPIIEALGLPFDQKYVTQKLGIDVIVKINGKYFTIDKKNRRGEHRKRQDVLLEEYSNTTTKRLGWMCNKNIDLLSYGFANETNDDIERIEIYWFKSLQEWFFENKERYEILLAQNSGYQTQCRIIPRHVIRKFDILWNDTELKKLVEKNNLISFLKRD